MEDSQLFNLAIPAPVLDERPTVDDRGKRRRKCCTQGLKVPLLVMRPANLMSAPPTRITDEEEYPP